MYINSSCHKKTIYQKFTEILQSKTEDRSSKNVILALKILGKINTLKNVDQTLAKSSDVAQVITSNENKVTKNTDSSGLINL